MKNVTQIVRTPEYDQLHLIIPKFRGMPMEEISDKLHQCIEGVQSSEEVILGVFLTNTRMFQYGGKNRYASKSLGVFPKYGATAQYELKHGDFFVNQGRDPIIILDAWNFAANPLRAILLFSKDPFTHLEEFEGLEEVLTDTGKYGWARNRR